MRNQTCQFLQIHVNARAGFVWVLENLESCRILLWHFPGLKSAAKKATGPRKFWIQESSLGLLNQTVNEELLNLRKAPTTEKSLTLLLPLVG